MPVGGYPTMAQWSGELLTTQLSAIPSGYPTHSTNSAHTHSHKRRENKHVHTSKQPTLLLQCIYMYVFAMEYPYLALHSTKTILIRCTLLHDAPCVLYRPDQNSDDSKSIQHCTWRSLIYALLSTTLHGSAQLSNDPAKQR